MNNMWKKIFVLLSGYVSFIAFAVLGGLVWYKNNEDEEVKKTVKLTLIVSLIFVGLSALLGLYNYIGSLWSNYYATDAYEAYDILSTLVSIAKIIVFAVLIIKELVNGLKNKEVAVNQKAQNKNESASVNKVENNSSNDFTSQNDDFEW